MLPVKATPIADGQIQKAARWWLANRDKAPNAFREELERGFALISQRPDVEAKATNVKLQGRSPYPPEPDSVLPLLPSDERPRGSSRLVAFESLEGPNTERAAEHAAGADRVGNAAAQRQDR